jgi:hypothetical protein
MQLDDQTFLKRFALRDLGPEYFDHRGHLRMAWLHLKHYPVEKAIQLVCDGIKQLAIQFGAPDKFNHSLTEALMRIMHKRIRLNPQQTFEEFLQHNREMVLDAQGLLAKYYSLQHLNSDAARQGWLPPDIKTLDIDS